MSKEQTVLIENLQKRAGGTKHGPIFGKVYHFKPETDHPEAPHVCALPFSDAAAVYRLLAIKSGFALVDPNAELPPRPSAEAGQTITDKAEGKAAIKPVTIKSPDGQEIVLTDLEPEPLRVLARDTFGITVHHKWADQTVIAKIIEKTRGED